MPKKETRKRGHRNVSGRQFNEQSLNRPRGYGYGYGYMPYGWGWGGTAQNSDPSADGSVEAGSADGGAGGDGGGI